MPILGYVIQLEVALLAAYAVSNLVPGRSMAEASGKIMGVSLRLTGPLAGFVSIWLIAYILYPKLSTPVVAEVLVAIFLAFLAVLAFRSATRKIETRKNFKDMSKHAFEAYLRSDYSVAVKIYEEMRILSKLEKDPLAEAVALEGMARSWKNTGEHVQAGDLYAEALELSLGIKKWELAGLCNLGLAELKQQSGDQSGFDTHLKDATKAFTLAGSLRGLGNVKFSEGRVLVTQGRYHEAEKRLQAARSDFRRADDNHGEANVLRELGKIAQAKSDFGGARNLFEASLRLYVGLGVKTGVANVQRDLGELGIALGRYQEAVEYLKKAQSLHRQIGDKLGEAGDDLNLAEAYHHLGENRIADSHFRRALDEFRQLGDELGMGTTLSAMASFEAISGRPHTALDHYSEALERLKSAGSASGVAGVLLRYADLLLRLQRIDSAKDNYEKAMRLFDEMDSTLNGGHARFGLAEVNLMIGKIDNATALLGEAKSRYAKCGYGQGMRNVRLVEADILLHEGKYSETRSALQKLLEDCRRVGDKLGVGNSYRALGNTSLAEGDRKKAVAFFRAAREVYAELGMEADVEFMGASINRIKTADE